MNFNIAKAVLLLVTIPAFTPALAQVATGPQPFGSFAGGPDIINLGNLNAYLTIPIRHKTGRGQDFIYDLQYNSSVYSPVQSNGTTYWQPDPNWGWQGLSPAGVVYEGYSETYSSGTCGQTGQNSYQSWSYSGLIYFDNHGVGHSFNGVSGSYISSNGVPPYCPPSGSNPSGVLTTSAGDGSGLTAQFYTDQNGFHATIYTANGQAINPPVKVNFTPPAGNLTSTDQNGNQITSNNGTFTDTLGQQALVVLGSAPSNTILEYTNAQGSYVSYTVSYKSYNIKTNFGCSVTEYAANGANLVDKVTLPDGRYYQFQYEPTPGYSNYYTGRPASITLPGGGQISYQYTGSNNGIVCSDGSTAGLNRTVSDGTTSNTWTYSRSSSSPTWTTVSTSPSYGVQNDTVYTFLKGYVHPSFFYEIKRQTYGGSRTSGTLVQTILHCYDSGYCDPTKGDTNQYVAGASITPIMTSLQWPDKTGITTGSLDQYDATGNMTSHAVFDYGAAGTGLYSTNPLQTTTLSYWTNPSTSSETSNPSEVILKDGSGSTMSDTKYGYDETAAVSTSGTPQHVAPPTGSRGNLTSMQQWVSGSTWQTTTDTNFDTGNVQTATDVNGGQTTYTYGNCGNSFATSISAQTGGSTVTSLTTSATWNCAGGVLGTTQDVNTNQTTYAYGSDPYWRPTSITNNATNASVSFSYPSPSSNSSGSAQSFNSGSSTNTSVMTYDGLGRTILRQTLQGPSASNYDTVATAYDSIGRVASTTLPYSATLGNYLPSNPGTSTSYDALNRIYTITDSGGGTTQYNFYLNDLLITALPQVTVPATENLKKRNLEYNGAGWLTSVCEVVVTTLPAGGACGQGVGYTGYLTKYSYDGAGRVTTVRQNAQSGSSGVQTRNIVYDGLNRKTSETIPEWSAGTGVAGISNYTYDAIASGNCSGTYRGDLLKSVDNMGNVTCYTYDLLHRPISSNVIQGPYSYATLNDPVKATPAAFFVYDAAKFNGTTSMQDAKGTLAEAYTRSPSTSSSNLTDEFFSTSPISSGAMAGGVRAQMWQSTPHSGGYFLTSDTYYPNGAVGAISASLSGASIGIPNLTFGVDGEGRPNAASDGTRNLVTATSYNPASSALQVTYGNASTGLANDVDTFTYDPQTLRPTNLTYSISPSTGTYSVTTALTWNANGSLQRMVYTDGSPSPMNQNCTYSADDLSRIAGVDCGNSQWGQNFNYDPFGNIQKSVPSGRTGDTYSTGGYSTVTNQASTGATYDKNGNQLTSTPATLTWNAWNVPNSVNGTSATYDALGRMVEKGSGSTYTEFVFRPSGASLAVYSGGLSKGTVPLPGGSTAIYSASGLGYVRHTDWLGSSRLATNWAHGVYSKEAYAPFGETYNESGTPDRSFTGQDQNAATGSGGGGAYDFLFRKYDPSAGRWLSPDPLAWGAVDISDPQSLDRYAYVENQPLIATDPSGLTSCVSAGTGANFDPGDDPCPDGWDRVDFLINANECPTCFIPPPSSLRDFTDSFDPLPYMGPLTHPDGSSSEAAYFLKQWWKDVSSCIANVAVPTIANDLSPIPSLSASGALSALQSTVSDASTATAYAAGKYSVERGLIQALSSSAVRSAFTGPELRLGYIRGAEWIGGKLLTRVTMLGIDYALWDAVVQEYKNCH